MRRCPRSPLSQARRLLEGLGATQLSRPQRRAAAERLRRLINRLHAAREEARRHRALLADLLALVERAPRMLRLEDTTLPGER